MSLQHKPQTARATPGPTTPGEQETQERSHTVEASALNANERLLIDNPGLLNFWDRDRNLWVVSHELLQKAVATTGVELPQPERVERRDLFDQVARTYAGIEVKEIKGAAVAVVNEEALAGQDVVELVDDKLLTALGCDVDKVLETEDPQEAWECLNGACKISVVRIETPAELPIDRDFLGADLRDRVKASVGDSFQKLSDKVGQREITSSLGSLGIEQPRFLDVRELNPPAPAALFSKIDLSGFPLEEIKTVNPAEKRIWVFEDVHQGFAVVHDGTRRFVTSKNGALLLAASLAEVSEDEVPKDPSESFDARLARFLQILKNKELPTIALACSEAGSELEGLSSSGEEQQQYRLGAEHLLTHHSPVFIKPTHSAGGESILRCAASKTGDSIIESNSPQVGEHLARYLKVVARYIDACQKEKDSPPGSVPHMIAKMGANSARDSLVSQGSVAGFLARALTSMETPTVEEEIPVVRLNTDVGQEKVEFRMIFQGHEKLNLVAHYTKCSLNEVAANISLNGFARATKEVIQGIFQQKLTGQLPVEAIEQRAAQSFENLERTAERFAQNFAGKLSEATRTAQLKDFAVDLCPVWDEQRMDLKLFLLEVQYRYGFSGLQSLDPEKAAQVVSFKEEAKKRATVKSLAKFLGLHKTSN